MDVAREGIVEAKRRRRIVLGAVAGVAILLVTLGLARLKPAAPTVERASAWIDTVKRGPMLIEVRGTGTLVPQEIRWIPAATLGRVERILVEAGSRVEADTVLMELSNPDVELQALDAEGLAREAQARYRELAVRLESDRLQQVAAAAQIRNEHEQADLTASMNEELAKDGLTSNLALKTAQFQARSAAGRNEMEARRLAIVGDSIAAQLAAQQSQVERQMALARFRRGQAQALRVRAGVPGVLQVVNVEVGQQIGPGTNLARVAQPERLKAVVKIAETQAKDVQIGHKASVDTRNGVVAAHVVRVDPAVKDGTVTVDLSLDENLPKGARPDLSVDATIEIEKLENVLYVGRPAAAQSGRTLSLFRLEPGESGATRVQVVLGRASVSLVEVVKGLAEGDRVVVSDTSEWDAHDRVRIQ
jgi:HlyD family secretion protein